MDSQNLTQQAQNTQQVPMQQAPSAAQVVSDATDVVQDVTQQQVPVTPVDQPLPQQAPQQISVTGPHKEFAPHAPIQPFDSGIRASEVEPVLEPEVTEAGVAVVSNIETPQITDDHKAIGILPAKDAVPVHTSPLGHVQLPMDEAQAKEVIKTHPVYDSVRWFAMLVVEQIEKAKKALSNT